MIDATRELLTDAADSIRRAAAGHREPVDDGCLPGPREPLRVLGYAANGAADELALTMLAQALDDLPIVIETVNARLLASELVSLVRTKTCRSSVSPICRQARRRRHATWSSAFTTRCPICESSWGDGARRRWRTRARRR